MILSNTTGYSQYYIKTSSLLKNVLIEKPLKTNVILCSLHLESKIDMKD